MNAATARYLLATKRLADAARTMSPATSRLRMEVGQAQAAWVDAGCPHCPEEPAPSVSVFICGRQR